MSTGGHQTVSIGEWRTRTLQDEQRTRRTTRKRMIMEESGYKMKNKMKDMRGKRYEGGKR